MPSIANLLVGLGCTQGVGADFYLPAAHPHVHIRVTNAALIAVDVAAIRQYIQFLVLSFGDRVNTAALHQQIGIAVAMDMRLMLNRLTGMGIDL